MKTARRGLSLSRRGGFAFAFVAAAVATLAPRAARAQSRFYCTSSAPRARATPREGAAGAQPTPYRSRCAPLRVQCEDARRAFVARGLRASPCAPRREAFCYAISLPGLSLATVECAVTLGHCRALRAEAAARARYSEGDPRVEACLILDPALAARVETSPTHRVRSPDAAGVYCHDEGTRAPPCAATHRACAESLRYERPTLSWDDAAVRCTARRAMHCLSLDPAEGDRCYRTAAECAAEQARRAESASTAPIARACHREGDAE